MKSKLSENQIKTNTKFVIRAKIGNYYFYLNLQNDKLVKFSRIKEEREIPPPKSNFLGISFSTSTSPKLPVKAKKSMVFTYKDDSLKSSEDVFLGLKSLQLIGTDDSDDAAPVTLVFD